MNSKIYSLRCQITDIREKINEHKMAQVEIAADFKDMKHGDPLEDDAVQFLNRYQYDIDELERQLTKLQQEILILTEKEFKNG